MDYQIHGVVFDWDGTLVDSQTHYIQAWRETLQASEYDLTAADVAFLVGRAFPDAFARFAGRAALGEFSDFQMTWRYNFNNLLSQGIEVYQDAVACLKHILKRRVRVAVATQTPRVQFDKALLLTGLAEVIEFSVCRDEVPMPKPAPDIYLKACQQISIRPENCLAIEDSHIGAAAARAAGLRVLGIVRSSTDADRLASQAHDVVSLLTPSRIESMFKENATQPTF